MSLLSLLLPFSTRLQSSACSLPLVILSRRGSTKMSKRLHLILPRLQSISFQRTTCGCVRRRYEPYMLAKAIPCGVRLSEVRFENEAAVDVFFGICRRLTHLGLDKVSGRIAKRVWRVFFFFLQRHPSWNPTSYAPTHMEVTYISLVCHSPTARARHTTYCPR